MTIIRRLTAWLTAWWCQPRDPVIGRDQYTAERRAQLRFIQGLDQIQINATKWRR